MPNQLLGRSAMRTAYQEAEYERFEKNKVFEEKTDIGERLGYHIDTTIHYELRDGAAYCLSDTKRRAFHEQTFEAMEAGRRKFTGNQAFEYVRLQHEHQEALDVDALMRGDLGANVMIKFSKVPDAVVMGNTDISGYRRDLLRSFFRIYSTNGDGTLQCRLFTLDGNNEEGLRRVGEIVEMDLLGRGSEDILADCRLLSMPNEHLDEAVGMLAESLKHSYDKGVYVATGRKSYAGSSFTDQDSALMVIDRHYDLFDEHYRAIKEISARVIAADDREQFMEALRRQTAAAIKMRMQGFAVDSVGDTAVVHEAANGEYGRECATGMNQTQSEQDLLADWVREVQQCPVCGAKNVTARKNGEIIEGVQCGCTANICTGEVRRGKRGKLVPQVERVVADYRNGLIDISNFTLYSYKERRAFIKQQFGEGAEEYRENGIGIGYVYVRDRSSGEIIAQL